MLASRIVRVSFGVLAATQATLPAAEAQAAPGTLAVQQALASEFDHCAQAPCEHGGVRIDGVSTYTCSCSGTGYTGPTCADNANECAGSNVCTADYPCMDLAPFYTCRGQFPDWNVSGVSHFSASNGVVTDSLTGLQWQQLVEERSYTWEEARGLCEWLVLDGKSDWRLPTITELRSIVDYSRVRPALDPVFPRGKYPTLTLSFLSSSGSSDAAWSVDFSDGYSSFDEVGEDYPGRVRCVRR